MNHRRNPTSSSSTIDAVLLSFDSWDYDASTVSGGAGGPASLLTSSMSGEDLSLCGKGQTSAFNIKSDSLLRLNVSGSTFCVEPKVFQKLERLPWKTEVTSPRAATILQRNTSANIPSATISHHDYYLRTAPELFEILLSHVLYGSFPDVRDLRQADVEELEPLILVLELDDLYQYMQKQEHWVGVNSCDNARKHRRVPSFRRRGSTKRSNMIADEQQQPAAQHQQQEHQPVLMSSSSKASALSSPSSSSSSVRQNQHVRTVSTSSIQSSDGDGSSITGGKIMRRMFQKTLGRGEGGSSQRRMTHAEWCANSGVIN